MEQKQKPTLSMPDGQELTFSYGNYLRTLCIHNTYIHKEAIQIYIKNILCMYDNTNTYLLTSQYINTKNN